jgi:dynein heavy chain
MIIMNLLNFKFVLYRDQDFENKVREAAMDLHLQAEEASPTAQNNFVLKVVQLKEIFDVRHSVFIIGNAGTGIRNLIGD